MKLEKILRDRVKRDVDKELAEIKIAIMRTLNPEHSLQGISISKYKDTVAVSLRELVDHIIRQRRMVLYEIAGDREVAGFVKKVDSMQDQLTELHEGIT